MKKRIAALLLCCVMLVTPMPGLFSTAIAEEPLPQEQTQLETDEAPAEQGVEKTLPEETPTEETPKEENEQTVTEAPVTEEPTADSTVPEDEEAAAAPAGGQPADSTPATEETVQAEDAQGEALPEGSSLVEPIYITGGEYPAVSAGEILGSQPAAPYRMLRASAVRTQTDSSESGSSGLQLSKTATPNDDGGYTITLEAYATGEQVTTTTTDPVDIVLMLDLSDYMYDTTATYKVEYKSGEAKLSDLFGKGAFYILENGNYIQIQASSVTSKKDGSISYQLLRLDTGASLKYSGRQLTEKTKINYDLYKKTSNKEDGSDKLNALKTAVNGFIDNVHKTAPTSRIAIVTYAGSAEVKSSTTGEAKESALVTVDDDGEVKLKEIVNGLTIQGGASNSHLAAADAVKIFQDVKEEAASRARVAILFSAGVPGSGWYTDNTSKKSPTSGQTIAQATMTLTSILKCERNRTLTPTSDNMDGGLRWDETEKDYHGSCLMLELTDTNYTGCGATVYCVGLDIPTSGDPSYQYIGNEPYKSGALANEYFYRVSSHRPTGGHISNINSLPDDWKTAYNARLSGTDYESLFYFYPDKLTRNLDKGYYLTTDQDNLDRLSDIFGGISTSIGTTVSTTLDSETVIKDIISPQFTLPAGAGVKDITLETYACKGKDDKDNFIWEKNEDAMGAEAIITSTDDSDETTQNNQVSVTGFDFAANYVGTETEGDNVTYRGNKLVIKFNVVSRDGFLGGNGVVTNTSAGVYKDANATEPLEKFEQPNVDVTIKEPKITVPDANVYLGAYFHDTISAEDLKKGTSITFDGVELNLTKPNWGLEKWQTEYVDITITVLDEKGNTVTDFKNLTDDTEYTVSVSIKPKTQKDSNDGYEKTMPGTIYVFKPELTFSDSTAYYGESTPKGNDYNGNLAEVKWKNGDKYSNDNGVTMMGKEPALTISYTPDAGKLDKGKYTKQDVPVTAAVAIDSDDVTGYTTFLHKDCTDEKNCAWTPAEKPGDPAFLIHIKTCTLNITKQGGAENEPYVFTVYKDGDGKEYSEVTVVGNSTATIVELPVGTYTIQEDTGWSWRYTAEDKASAKLTAEKPTDTITCTNTETNSKWLNGFSGVVKNIIGIKQKGGSTNE